MNFIGGIFTYQFFNTAYPNGVIRTPFLFDREAQKS